MPEAERVSKLEQQRLKLEVAQQRTLIEEARFRIMEIAEQVREQTDAIRAAELRIEELSSTLRALQKEQGPLTEVEFVVETSLASGS